MATATINGISVHYETRGSGPPLLMMAPGAMDSTIRRWSEHNFWKQINPLETFSRNYTCIAYDRREAGESGGRVERLSWDAYTTEAKGLLEHLGFESGHILASCMGCNLAVALAVRYPQAVRSLVLYYPTGGAAWHQSNQRKFSDHAAFVEKEGLKGVVASAREKSGGVMATAALGPWGGLAARDPKIADELLAMPRARYLTLAASGRSLFDRDTAPGAEPEEIQALQTPAIIIPGDDASHAMSAAQYLHECLPHNDFKNVHPKDQKPDVVAEWVTGFLQANR